MNNFTPQDAALESQANYARYKKHVDIRSAESERVQQAQEKLNYEDGLIENIDETFSQWNKDQKPGVFARGASTPAELKKFLEENRTFTHAAIDEHSSRAHIYSRVSQGEDIERAQKDLDRHAGEYFSAALGDAAINGVSVNVGSPEQEQASAGTKQLPK